MLYQSGNKPRNVFSLDEVKKRNSSAVIDYFLKKEFGSSSLNCVNSVNEKEMMNRQFTNDEMFSFAKEE